MGRFYGIKVKNEEMTLDEVPKLWRASAQKWIEENQ